MSKLISYFLLLSVVVVSLVASVAYYKASQALEKSIYDQLNTTARLKEAELIRWVSDQEQSVIYISLALEGRRDVERILMYDSSTYQYESSYQYLSDYLTAAQQSQDSLDEIFILSNEGGQIVLSTEPDHEELYRISDEFFVNGQLDTYVQNVYPSPITDKPTLTIATPIRNVAGEQIAVLAAHLNLDRMDKIVFERLEVGFDEETGVESYLVDRLNQFVSSKRFGRDGFTRGVHSDGVDAAVKNKKNGTALYNNYNHIPVLGAYRWIDSLELALMAEIPQDEAFAPARDVAITIIWAGLASAALLAVGVYLLARQIAKPILAMTDVAVKVTTGDLTQTVSVMTEDEIGVLAVAFNTMQTSLRLYQDQLKEYAHTLEERVVERTAELERANTSLTRQALQLQASSQVSQQITYILKPDKLLREVVSLIETHFNYYYVGIWLLIKKDKTLVLQAGAGRTEEKHVTYDLRIPLDASSIIAGVCRTGKYRLVDNVYESDEYLVLDPLPDTKSELTLPLRIGDEVLGVLDIQSDKLAGFSSEDKLVFQTLADQITIAIRNARLYEAEQRRRGLAEALEETSRVISSSLDLEQMPPLILEQVAQTVPYERGSVMLQYGDNLRIVAQHGFPDSDRALSINVPIKKGDVFERAVASKKPVLVDDVTQEKIWYYVEWLELNHSWMGVPLIAKDRVIGVISLTRRDIAAFSPSDATLVLAFAGHAAIALENAQLYEELTGAYQTLERLDKAKSDFISITSHELRTPLTVISGYGQIAMNLPGIKDNTTALPLVEGMVNGVARLYEIVNMMLDISKIDMKELYVYKEDTSLASIVEGVSFKYETALKERQLNFEMIDLETLPIIQADPDLMLKVFIQLIGNAIKYTPDGGLIKVSGLVLDNKNEQEPMIQITVSDTGIGINPEDHNLIFEKFYQTGEVALHSSGQTKFKGGGPGVGLAIVKGIVVAHGGKIWVDSKAHDEENNPGSKFHIQLPVGEIDLD